MSGWTFSGCRTLDDEQTVHVCKHDKIRCIPQFYKAQGFYEMDSCNVKREQKNHNLRNKYWRNSNRNKLNIDANAIDGGRDESHLVNNSVICKSSSKLNDGGIIETKKSLANKVGFSASRPKHLNLDRFLVTKSPDYPPNREIVRTSSERGWRDTAGSQGTMSPMSDKDSTPQTKRQSYTSDYLMELRKIPPSLEKPKNLPSIPGIILCKPVLSLANAPIHAAELLPLSTSTFISTSCRHLSPKKSSARSRGSKSSSSAPKKKRSDPARKIISLNLNSEVRLHTSKNAWKASSVKTTPSEGICASFKQDVCSKLRGLLNKLSARNFENVSYQISRLPVKDEEMMMMCINIIFEKAVMEPNFSELYAALSKKFSKWTVPAIHGPAKFVSFKDLIITRCQHEFEKDKYGEHDSDPLTPELEPINDKVEGDLDVFKKKRTLGNIRFIGELYMQDMLQEVVIHQCIMDLLKYRHDEDRLESLCKLLTVVGRKIDFLRSKPRIDQYFKRIADILNKKDISSRIRFMLRDIIELRENNWIPRHANSKPQFLRQSSLSTNRSNFDVIASPVKKSISNDESKLYSTLPRNFSYSQRQFGMTAKCPEVKDNSWFKIPPTILNRNTRIIPSKPVELNNINNTLESKTHLNKKPTLEKLSQDTIKISQCDDHDIVLGNYLDEISLEQVERKCTNFLNEFLNVGDFEEAAIFFEEMQAAVSKCCETLITQSLEKNFTDRSKLGDLFIFVLLNKHLSSDSFMSSIEGILGCSEDLEIDIPKVWDYLAEILFKVVLSDPVQITRKIFMENSSLVTNHFKKLMKILTNVVKVIKDKKGFDESVDVYLNIRKVNPQCCLEEVLMNGTNTDTTCTECLTYYKDLQNILLVEDWFPELKLQELEKEMLKDNRLERLEYMKMMVKLVGKSVTLNEPPSVDMSKLRASCGYLKRFVEEYDLELELLNATQEFVCNINHPYGVLRSFFDAFYDEDVVSEEIFNTWYYSDDSTSVPGKGVAKESVSKFFEWLHLSEDEHHQ